MSSLLTFILAGGKGERLYPLTNSRAKPLLPFLGGRRLIDFTLFNCVQSGIFQAWALTCNDAVDLDLSTPPSWDESQRRLLDRMDGKRWVESLQKPGYAGTADAVRQNLSKITREVREVLVLASDHVYAMDYRALLDFHRRKGALVTVGASEVHWREADRLGVLVTDPEDRVNHFLEKPRDTADLSARFPKALASMGIYVFDADFLSAALPMMAGNDFGRDILPALLRSIKVFAFNATAHNDESWFWRDVGTIDTYWETQIEILQNRGRYPALLGSNGRSRPRHFGELMPARAEAGCPGVQDFPPSAHSQIFQSALSRGAAVRPGAKVVNSVLLEGAVVELGAQLCCAVVDRDAVVSSGSEIGFDRDKDEQDHFVSEGGVVVVAAEQPVSPGKPEAPRIPHPRAYALSELFLG